MPPQEAEEEEEEEGKRGFFFGIYFSPVHLLLPAYCRLLAAVVLQEASNAGEGCTVGLWKSGGRLLAGVAA